MAVSRPFWTLVSPLFRCFIRLDARNPASGAKRPGAGSVTVQNGRQKSGRRRSLEEWDVRQQRAHARNHRQQEGTKARAAQVPSEDVSQAIQRRRSRPSLGFGPEHRPDRGRDDHRFDGVEQEKRPVVPEGLPNRKRVRKDPAEIMNDI